MAKRKFTPAEIDLMLKDIPVEQQASARTALESQEFDFTDFVVNAPVQPQTQTQPATTAQADLSDVMSAIKALNKRLDDQDKAKADAQKTTEAAKRANDIKTLLDSAQADGRIAKSAEERAKWEKRLESGYDATAEILAETKPNPAFKADDGDGDGKKQEAPRVGGLGASQKAMEVVRELRGRA